MKRDLERLGSEKFDVAIIGAGIHGAAVAERLSAANYSVALIDAKDFGNATSANSLKIIHGGLRYLQHLNLKRMRESVVSRRFMTLLAPHLIKPLPCVIPTYGHGLKSKEVFKVAMLMNDLISWDRNKGVDNNNFLPQGKILNKNTLNQFYPGSANGKLNGGACWYDALAMDTERLTLAFIQRAEHNGAAVANYVKAANIIVENKKTKGVIVKDYFSEKEFLIKANRVVNASGPWFERLLPESIKTGRAQKTAWAKAVNIVVKKNLFEKYAVGVEGSRSYSDQDAFLNKGKRFFFFVPWRDYTMIGTSYQPFSDSPENLTVTKSDVRDLVGEINEIFPAADLDFSDVTFVHSGILPRIPAKEEDNLNVQIDKHSEIINHRQADGLEGLYSIKGVKYTTAPEIAGIILRMLDEEKISKSGRDTPVPNNESRMPDAENEYWQTYGEETPVVHEYLREHGSEELADANGVKLTAAEIIYFIREEMAQKLSDIILRRTAIGTAQIPDKLTLEKIVDVMGAELGWNREKKNTEIHEVCNAYKPLEVNENNSY